MLEDVYSYPFKDCCTLTTNRSQRIKWSKILEIAELCLLLQGKLGRLAEWPNALDSKSGIPFLGIGGLNPSSSAFQWKCLANDCQ